MVKVANIPIIDISGDGYDETQVAKDLVEAAIEHGFVYIRNTGEDIPVDAVESAFNLSRELFAAPLEEKQKCTIQQNNRGVSPQPLFSCLEGVLSSSRRRVSI